MEANSDEAVSAFTRHRPKLMLVAYRMLGSVSDAEDMVQEALIRWIRADRTDVRTPEAFLCRTVTRLCLDQLRVARRERETYIGPWLPDPTVDEEQDEDVTLPLMLVLERLSPLERATFLLHDVFGLGFEEIGVIVERSATACRQLATRARVHVRQARPRFEVDKKRGLELAQSFFAASRTGDMESLRGMLAADVSIHADSGGKRPSVTEPILGFDAVIKIQERLAVWLREHASTLVRVAFVNGLPGFVTREADDELQTTALEIEGGKIAAIYVMRNPEKMRHLQIAPGPARLTQAPCWAARAEKGRPPISDLTSN